VSSSAGPKLSGSDLNFDLCIGIDDEFGDPEGYVSTDSCDELMEQFFGMLGMRYAEVFVSLWICPKEDGSLSAKQRRDSFLASTYGRQYRLKPQFIDRVAIVASGDFLNIMSRTMADYLRAGILDPEQTKQIRPIEDLQVLPKIEAIWQAHREKDANTPYAEARIYSCFHREWFEECDINSIVTLQNADLEDTDIEF
jgi:hypothetical protein